MEATISGGYIGDYLSSGPLLRRAEFGARITLQ